MRSASDQIRGKGQLEARGGIKGQIRVGHWRQDGGSKALGWGTRQEWWGTRQ